MTWGFPWGTPWGQAFAWGARENGDPADTTSPLVPIPVGQLNAVQSATDRIPKQWAQTVTWSAIMEVIGELFGDVDRVLAQVRLFRSRSNAVGLQLEDVGGLVGRSRGALSSDDDYRLAIMADAWSKISSGTGPEVIDIVQALTDGQGMVRGFPPATFRVRVPDLPPGRFALLADILSDVPAAAVAAVISTYDSSAVGSFSSIYAALEGESSGLVFRPNALDLVDPVSGQTGVADGTDYVLDVDGREYRGAPPGDRIDYSPGIADFADVPFSVAAWVNFDTLAVESRIWSTQRASSSGSHFFSVDTSGRLRMLGATSGTFLDVRSTDTIGTGVWHHVAVTVDGSNLAAGVRLYIDGDEVSAYTTTTDGTGTQEQTDFLWSLGGREATDTNNVDGQISDVRAWSRELASREIDHIHAQGALGGFDGPPSASEVAPLATFSSYHGSAPAAVRGLFSTCRAIG